MESKLKQELPTDAVTVQDLINVCHDTYTLFDNPDAKLIGIKGFDLIRHEHDKRSDHSALAYYQESTGTLVLGHRGSATAKDWLMTDVAIAFNAKQTKADLAAIKFADSVIWDLNRDEKPVNTVIETGHSKGGRESQTVLRHLMNKGQGLIDCVGLTLNSACVHKTPQESSIVYDHVNLQITGGSRFSTDVVSGWGNHLGQQVKMVNPEVSTFLGAHGMKAFDSGMKYYDNMSSLDVRKLIKGCQAGIELSKITNENYGQEQVAARHIEAPALPYKPDDFPAVDPSIVQFRYYNAVPENLTAAADYVVAQVNQGQFGMNRAFISGLEQHLPQPVNLSDEQLEQIQALPPFEGAVSAFHFNEHQSAGHQSQEVSMLLSNSILMANNLSPINASKENLSSLQSVNGHEQDVQHTAQFFLENYPDKDSLPRPGNDHDLALR